MKIKTFVNPRSFSCNVFVCSGEKGTFIVDLGYFDSEIEAYLNTLPPVEFILQTHGHFDHIEGLNDFSKKYPEVPVYCHSSEIEVATDTYKNGSAIMRRAYTPEVKFLPLKEGGNRLGKYDFKVIHTPGHTQGSCLFLFKDEEVLFTGDTIIETSIGRTDFPTGDEAAMFRSLKKISNMDLDEQVMCYFGHGANFNVKTLRKQNQFLR